MPLHKSPFCSDALFAMFQMANCSHREVLQLTYELAVSVEYLGNVVEVASFAPSTKVKSEEIRY